MEKFILRAPFPPGGDQPQAIERLVEGIEKGLREQTLLGVTGSGKTFTMANVIARFLKPTLVISHNKTLAAQLCSEFREFFPDNAVEYFVSYYDYYQPEAYIPKTDTYIEKDAMINDEIDRLRHAATQAVLRRKDVIIVASVSCIYGLGSPEDYMETLLILEEGKGFPREEMIKQLVRMQFERNELELSRGKFRAKGEVVEIYPADEEVMVRATLDGEKIERLSLIDPVSGKALERKREVVLYPAKHFITPDEKLQVALKRIDDELEERLAHFRGQGKLLEAQRLETRTRYDLEMLREIGYCSGIENYSRHLSLREKGQPPATLLSYFPKDFLLFIDESHVTIPQLRGMYEGDRSRKETLVEHGFRLPSALDNRPLKWDEFYQRIPQVIHVSATPGPFELRASLQVVEQIVRPTGLVDPEVIVRPPEGQLDDLIREIRTREEKKERVLVTTLTKKMAEDLTEYLARLGIAVRYLHSEIETLDRIQILTDLRLGEFDVLVGINLLREGLDLPEVSLVAILDADKEGFLRSETTLIQTMGRAARHVSGQVILYASEMTDSMQKAIGETRRRRAVQMEYNRNHGIVPQGIQKSVRDILEGLKVAEGRGVYRVREKEKLSQTDLVALVEKTQQAMYEAAKGLEFEKAAALRDEIYEIRKMLSKEAPPSLLLPDQVVERILSTRVRRRGGDPGRKR